MKLTKDDKKLLEHFYYDYKTELIPFAYTVTIKKIVEGFDEILKNQEKAEMWDMGVTDAMEIVERLKKRIEELKSNKPNLIPSSDDIPKEPTNEPYTLQLSTPLIEELQKILDGKK